MTTPTMFDEEPGGLAEGRKRRDRGQANALSATEQAWKDAADRWVAGWLRSGGRRSSLDLVAAIGQPSRPNAMGAVFGSLSRTGIIREVGRVQGTRASQHGRRIALWEVVPVAEREAGAA